MPATFLDGFLSGIGHPVIGPDHLAFIVAIGIASALVPAGAALVAAFIATSTAGVLIHASRLDVPLTEPLIAASVVVAGALIAFSRRGAGPAWLALAAIAGLFHGYAFGETVVGAERGVIGAYLVGLALVASLIALAAGRLTPTLLAGAEAASPRLRTAGAVVGCIGLVMFAGNFITG